MGLYKNVAGQKLAVYAYDAAADAPKTGDAANIAAQISKDFGAAAATNDAAPTELDAVQHPGVYVFDLTQSETNADAIVVTATSSTVGVVLDPVQVFTVPPNFRAFDLTVAGAVTAGTVSDKTGYTVSTVSDKTGYSLTSAYDPAKTAAQAGDAMALTSGERASTATAVWASTTRTLSSFGTLVADVWAAVVDSAGITTLLDRLTGTRATALDNLDAAVSSRLADADYTVPPTASENADALLGRTFSGGADGGTTVGMVLAAGINAQVASLDEEAGTATLQLYDADDQAYGTLTVALTKLKKSITGIRQ